MERKQLPPDPKRREFIKSSLAAGSLLLPLPNLTSPDTEVVNSEVENQLIKNRFIMFAAKLGVPHNTGYRTSEVWQENDGHFYINYQQIMLRQDPNGQIEPIDLLEKMSQRGLDPLLDSGSLGVTIPPPRKFVDEGKTFEEIFEERTKKLKYSQDLLDYLDNLKQTLNPGLPTAAPKDYGPYRVYRFQKMAFQRWKKDDVYQKADQITHILVGDAAQIAGLVPKEAIAQFSGSQNDLEVVAAAPACLSTGQAWEGSATYYSHAGCLGCSYGQIMANGEPFRENDLTIAFMRAPLNSYVKVTNLDNGLSTVARVTDRGGFEAYGILADLSVGTRNAIGGSGRTNIKIEILSC